MRGALDSEAVRRHIGTAVEDPQAADSTEGASPEGASPEGASSEAVGPEAVDDEQLVDAATEHWRRKPSKRDQRRLWRDLSTIENSWETPDETAPGIIRRLDRLATARRLEVLFITTRPPTAGDTPQRQSQRWLEHWEFGLPSVYVVSGSRGKVASALDLDIVVDDRPENCPDLKVDSNARAILVLPREEGETDEAAKRRLDARALDLRSAVVQSVRECLDMPEALEPPLDPRSRRKTWSGLMRWLTERLGLGKTS